jgi:hypothetical protein
MARFIPTIYRRPPRVAGGKKGGVALLKVLIPSVPKNCCGATTDDPLMQYHSNANGIGSDVPSWLDRLQVPFCCKTGIQYRATPLRISPCLDTGLCGCRDYRVSGNLPTLGGVYVHSGRSCSSSRFVGQTSVFRDLRLSPSRSLSLDTNDFTEGTGGFSDQPLISPVKIPRVSTLLAPRRGE